MKKTYKNIGELLEAVKSGDIPEEKLTIYIDVDCCHFLVQREGAPFTNDPLLVESSKGGNGDVEELYKLLFPTADVREV